MKERPILFSAPMVRAILSGNKSQTRRIVKRTDSGRVKAPDTPRNWHLEDPDATKACPYGQPGDRLWVRETFLLINAGAHCIYREDVVDALGCVESAGFASMYGGWKPSIFMPRKWSRITLEVIGVRVERLQDITEADAEAEGAEPLLVPPDGGSSPHVDGFRALWDQINGKRAPWASNPWIWVLKFKRVAS